MAERGLTMNTLQWTLNRAERVRPPFNPNASIPEFVTGQNWILDTGQPYALGRVGWRPLEEIGTLFFSADLEDHATVGDDKPRWALVSVGIYVVTSIHGMHRECHSKYEQIEPIYDSPKNCLKIAKYRSIQKTGFNEVERLMLALELDGV